ncbi:MAG: UDP-glucose 4-epimerase, partial [Candidatus Binatota bacterium]|nr:UDP-glucose 4-epimerase [Candidatus Binatota bacterium]
TGGAGFIGHHLARALLARGLAVTVLDDLSMGRAENVPPEARLVTGDVRDAAALETALEGVDCVFHEAAMVSVRASRDRFVDDAGVNLMGTLQLLHAMERARVRNAVLASSMAVYADRPRREPIAESAPTEPISAYGIAKLAAEKYWLLLCRAAGIRATVLRYFNTYGPGQSFTPYVGVVTIFVDRLLAGKPPLIFGDGEQCRDYVHVGDVVAANLLALDSECDGRIFNVGTGNGTTVNEIASDLIARLAPGLEPIYEPAQPGEVRNSIADIAAIRRALGFQPTRPRLDCSEVIAFRRAAAGSRHSGVQR